MLHFESCISFMGYSQNLTSRLLVYALSIEESTRSRTSRNLKMGRSYEQSQPRFKTKLKIKMGLVLLRSNIRVVVVLKVLKLLVIHVGRISLGNVQPVQKVSFVVVRMFIGEVLLYYCGQRKRRQSSSSKCSFYGAAKRNHFFFFQAKTNSGEDVDKLQVSLFSSDEFLIIGGVW